MIAVAGSDNVGTRPMRVACVQLCSIDEIEANLAVAAGLLEKAAAAGARLAVLPENFSYMNPDNAAKRRVAGDEVPNRVLPFLAEAAVRHDLYIVGGSVLLPGAGDKLRNACPVYGPTGSCLAVYDKIHLFDIELPGESYRESDLIEAGTGPVSVELDHWRVGLSICYDLRFPELYRRYADEGCQLITVPSAFTVPTGEAHWEVLLRARAIENQAYVLAPAQLGTHPGGRRTWGHSLIIDPWGEIVARAEDHGRVGGELVMADIDLERVAQVRQKVPALNHRRLVS